MSSFKSAAVAITWAEVKAELLYAFRLHTGALLDANGRDFSLVFLATAAVQVAGAAVWLRCWDSKRLFD